MRSWKLATKLARHAEAAGRASEGPRALGSLTTWRALAGLAAGPLPALSLFALLPLLSLFALLALPLLILLSGLPCRLLLTTLVVPLSLLATLTHATLERLEATDEITRVFHRVGEPFRLRCLHPGRGLLNHPLQLLKVGVDSFLELLRVRRAALLHHALRVAHLVGQLRVANPFRRLLQAA